MLFGAYAGKHIYILFSFSASFHRFQWHPLHTDTKPFHSSGVHAWAAVSAAVASWQPCHATKSGERTIGGAAGHGATCQNVVFES